MGRRYAIAILTTRMDIYGKPATRALYLQAMAVIKATGQSVANFKSRIPAN